jgi:hypothetical protein
MPCTKLAIASLAAAAAACAVTLLVLRERPSPGHAQPVAIEPERTAAIAAAPEPAPTLEAPDLAQRVSERAREAAAREQALRDAILRIGDDDSVTLDVRLERYRAALETARAGAPDTAGLALTPSLSAEVFLRMEGVQRELAALGPGARAREIAFIRRELGFGDEEIARMAEVDERREARWQNGLAYMDERARIAATFEGGALDEELRALRERYFAHEAATIEAEERDGFFRFARPRIYGRN